MTERPVSATDTSEARLLLSTAYSRLQENGKAIAAARQAASDQPFNPMTYRGSAVALLNAQHPDEAAVELMTGFMVTGTSELRSALVDLYRSGLDANGCATSGTGSNVVLNVSCEIVRRHLCEAAARATRIQRDAGHPDLAEQVGIFTRDAKCDVR